MKTPAIIEGLTILQKYRDEPDGYHTGGEHDSIYADATDRPLSEPDLKRMIELGWTQDNYDEEFTPKDYNPSESWEALT